MPSKTTPNRRKWHRRQVVAYYRGLPTGADADSIAVQKEIVGRWAAENDHEIVEEFIDRSAKALDAVFARGAMISQQVTKQGEVLYVIRLDTERWRRWRRGDMSLRFRNLSKNVGDRAVFVTTDEGIADYLSFQIVIGSFGPCCSRGRRISLGLAHHRAKRMASQAANGSHPQASPAGGTVE
jgi:hypothetical protein